MKSFVLVLSVVLTACGHLGASRPRVEAFEASDRCPHICWLGINPGVTSAEVARAILMASDEIDRVKVNRETETGIQTAWWTDTSNFDDGYVWLTFERGLVESITFRHIPRFELKDFVAMMGEPDTLAIRIDQTPDGGDIVGYATYFSAHKASVEVYGGDVAGPSPDDPVNALALNSEFGYHLEHRDAVQQPWLGYRKLEEYLRNNLPPSP